MEIIMAIGSLVIAIVIVAAKLTLEHQYDLDKLHGVADDPSAYTLKGMLKMMRQDRKMAKAAKREAYRAARLQKSASVPADERLNVGAFQQKQG